LANYDLDVAFLLMKMQRHFGDINEDQGLTEADKKQFEGLLPAAHGRAEGPTDTGRASGP
jgi:hypothetical protein